MKITVTTTSQNLKDILTSSQLDQINVHTSERTGISDLLIQNKGSDAIYVEVWADATTTDSFEVISGEVLSIQDKDIQTINLIAWVENTDVRILNN